VVPLAQTEAMAAAMRGAGAAVRVQVYDGEGHGFRKLSTLADEYDRTAAFLEEWVVTP
jgi:dipeptidyl aminopeptidase/acylaminoacyl peptidase